MINSLSKDSHMSQSCRFQNNSVQKNRIGDNVSQNLLSVGAFPAKLGGIKQSNQILRSQNPNLLGGAKTKEGLSQDNVSFKGKNSFAELANSNEFASLFESAKNILGKESKLKDIVDLISYSTEKKYDELFSVVKDQAKPAATKAKGQKRTEIQEKVPQLLQEQGEMIGSKIKSINEALLEENKVIVTMDGKKVHLHLPKINKETNQIEKDANGNDIVEKQYRLGASDRRSATIGMFKDSAECYPDLGKKHSILTSKKLSDFLIKAKENNVAFSAGFALLLTCILRPASIMTLPGDKKNVDDQKYAAAHSIASGVIGYVIATAVSNPVADALKKVLDNPQGYMKDKAPDYNPAKVSNAVVIEASTKTRDCANKWVTRSVDIALAVPKAIITIALIPVILKNVFGWEKKSKKVKQQDNTQLGNANVANDATLKKFQEAMGVNK